MQTLLTKQLKKKKAVAFLTALHFKVEFCVPMDTVLWSYNGLCFSTESSKEPEHTLKISRGLAASLATCSSSGAQWDTLFFLFHSEKELILVCGTIVDLSTINT